MENITRLYNALYQELTAIDAQGRSLAAQRQKAGQQQQAAEAAVRAQYAQKRRQLEEDLQTAQSFIDGTIALVGGRAPGAAPQKPDFVRMQQLYVAIDSPYDPEVGQLLSMASGAIAYLQQQKNQLQAQEAAAIRSAAGSANTQQQDDALLMGKYQALLNSPLMLRLANAVKDQSSAYFINKQESYDLPLPTATSELLKFGVAQRPFPVPSPLEGKLQSLFGVYYDPKTKTLRLPFGFNAQRAVKILIRTPDTLLPRLQLAMRGLLFNILRHYTPLAGRVVYLDPATYHPEHLGLMKHFAGTDRMITFPTSEKESLSALNQLVHDSCASGDDQFRFLIVRGYPTNISPALRDRIRNICHNNAQYRISVILTGPLPQSHLYDAQDNAAFSGALSITGDDQYYYLEQNGEKPIFAFFTAPNTIASGMVKRYNDATAPKRLGCKYPDRVPMQPPIHTAKGQRFITVPYGVDAQDRLCALDFSNTNFSMYLMGAAGSGKSTLLHTIITGLIRNYHPDDVELWLADFKMSEFAQYIDPLPPHVKYILLDESPELVYDFVELLTRELMRRKQYFSRNPKVKKLEALSDQVHMPTIFVIIDEFSLMSQAISMSDRHKDMLTNLLTEGRAMGFKFIFASQEYTKGVQGLSGAARDQVQTRIAMKNTTDEIRQTLDIPGSAMTDTYRQWIDTLPPFVALYKYYDTTADRNQLSRAQVLYFPAQDHSQQRMIGLLRKQLRPVSRYDPTDPLTYVDKQPVIADGTSYRAFSPQELTQRISHFRSAHPEDVFDEDIFFSPGDPRRLISAQLVQLTDESRENILLLTGNELSCAMSVIQSAAKAFALQKGSVQVWAYRRHRLYKLYKDSQMGKYRCFHDPQDIGSAISQLKQQIKDKRSGNQLIILLGTERLLEELENQQWEDPFDMKALAVSSPQEQADYDRVKDIQQAMSQELDRIEEEGEAAGKSEEQIEKEMNDAIARYMNKKPAAAVSVPAPKPIPLEKPDYTADLQYIVNHGSKYGYHFLLCAEDYPKLRSAKLKPELFRHKLSFCISADDASAIFGRRRAAQLPARVGLYNYETGEYTFRPYLHKGICWDEWRIDSTGNATRESI